PRSRSYAPLHSFPTRRSSDLTYFDIQVSLDTVTWTMVFSGQSSGQTLQLESYAFPTASGRYVRIVGHGNNQSTWNSIAEVAILGDRKSTRLNSSHGSISYAVF